MTEGRSATHDDYDTFEEAMAQARAEIAEATRPTFHNKTLVVVSDDQNRILWAAASDGWEAKTLVVVSDDQNRILWAAASDGWEAPITGRDRLLKCTERHRANNGRPPARHITCDRQRRA
jgi:hypothetical protein